MCGIIDGTLIPIGRAGDMEQQFVDRKGAHSLNMLLVCGPDHEFLFRNASWPGSVNAVRVLRNSSCTRPSR